MKNLLFFIAGLFLMYACSGNGDRSDAYGNFESIETIISSEAQGILLKFQVEEGMKLGSGKLVGLVDTVGLKLKKDQVFAQLNSALARLAGIQSQIDVQEEQKKNLLIEKTRVEKLLKDKAIPEKQLDDISGNLRVLESQVNSVNIQKKAVAAEMEGVRAQLRQLDDQLRRCRIVNPIAGTVLEKYAEPFELVNPGKPLYKIANLDTLILRAYVSGSDLSNVKLGAAVEVRIDDSKDPVLKGVVSWVSPQAEFTPKIIQTRKERVNLVYAVKILVPNDGRLKIGMPAEVNFIQK